MKKTSVAIIRITLRCMLITRCCGMQRNEGNERCIRITLCAACSCRAVVVCRGMRETSVAFALRYAACSCRAVVVCRGMKKTSVAIIRITLRSMLMSRCRAIQKNSYKPACEQAPGNLIPILLCTARSVRKKVQFLYKSTCNR